jgi:zona occludens toxin (predicted ATPase)
VHVDFAYYRNAYAKAFPAENSSDLDVDHVLNRRIAKVKDFAYVRLVAISRAANRSSGGLSEKWGVEYHSSETMRAKNLASPARIQYADLADIVKILDRKTGGSHQDPVNEAQALVRPPKEQ